MIYEHQCQCGVSFAVNCEMRDAAWCKPCPTCGADAPRSAESLPAVRMGDLVRTSGGYNRPRYSMAMGCHRSEIREQQEKLRAAGCKNVQHNERGDLLVVSEKDRKQKAEALGLFDPNGGLGSPRRAKDKPRRW